jgi:hypothetical protein
MLSVLVTETDFTSPAAPAMIKELLRMTTNGALDAIESGEVHTLPESIQVRWRRHQE